MKKLFKWFFRLLLVLVLLLALLILFLDPIAKSLVEKQIRKQTGLDVKIGRVSLGLKSPTLTIENFTLVNSAEFGGSTFLAIPESRAQYDLAALRSRKIHLNLARINLAELHVVQNREGKSNLQALRERRQTLGSAPDSNPGAVEFQSIDTLQLAIGRLKFTSEKNPAKNEEAYVGYKNETVRNVKSMKDLEPLIARISLEKDVKFLSEMLSTPGTNGSAAPSAGKGAQNALHALSDGLSK